MGSCHIFCAILTLQFSACKRLEDTKNSETNNKMVQEHRIDLLGTVITISSYENIDPEIFEDTFSIVDDIDARMSVNNTQSEINEINENSGKASVKVSKDIYDLIKWASDFSKISNGAFDITIGGVMQLWKSGGEFNVLPKDEDIKRNLEFVNNDQIIFSDQSIFLNSPETKIDLGGIAKGYACDKSLEYLKSKEVNSAILSFGGNIYAYGTKPDGSPWKIGIQTPYIKTDEIVCTIDVVNASVVTSGGYKRYLQKENVTYHHILNPKTGYPANSGLLSATIIDTSSTRADALSTRVLFLGWTKDIAFLNYFQKAKASLLPLIKTFI